MYLLGGNCIILRLRSVRKRDPKTRFQSLDIRAAWSGHTIQENNYVGLRFIIVSGGSESNPLEVFIYSGETQISSWNNKRPVGDLSPNTGRSLSLSRFPGDSFFKRGRHNAGNEISQFSSFAQTVYRIFQCRNLESQNRRLFRSREPRRNPETREPRPTEKELLAAPGRTAAGDRFSEIEVRPRTNQRRKRILPRPKNTLREIGTKTMVVVAAQTLLRDTCIFEIENHFRTCIRSPRANILKRGRPCEEEGEFKRKAIDKNENKYDKTRNFPN